MIADYPTCSVCFEVYTSETRIPKILPCGHSFCIECLKQLVTLMPEATIVKCPNRCGTWDVSYAGVEETFKSNFGLLTAMSYMKEKLHKLENVSSNHFSRWRKTGAQTIWMILVICVLGSIAVMVWVAIDYVGDDGVLDAWSASIEQFTGCLIALVDGTLTAKKIKECTKDVVLTQARSPTSHVILGVILSADIILALVALLLEYTEQIFTDESKIELIKGLEKRLKETLLKENDLEAAYLARCNVMRENHDSEKYMHTRTKERLASAYQEITELKKELSINRKRNQSLISNARHNRRKNPDIRRRESRSSTDPTASYSELTSTLKQRRRLPKENAGNVEEKGAPEGWKNG